jgi:two-component system, LytTR family, sensor kinase
MDAINSRPARQWIWIATIWLGLGIIDASQTVLSMRSQGMQHSWVALFVTLWLSWVPWMFATPIVISLGRRYPPVSVKPATWLIHLSAAIALTVIAAAWETAFESLLHPWAPSEVPATYLESWVIRLETTCVSSLVLYAFILTISFLLDSRLRLAGQQTDTARLNEQLSNARLSALRHQIEPHFIFNTLNATVGLVREGRNDAAVNMIVALSDFLRRVAKEVGEPQVALGLELEFLEKYLEIQKLRFAERLSVQVAVPDDLLDAQIPSLLLQPLVENAIKHGIAQRVQGGALRIGVSSHGGTLRLSVYNDGPPLQPDWETARAGIGLANLRTRLSLLYGGDCELRVENHAGSGVQVSVSVPYRKVEQVERE